MSRPLSIEFGATSPLEALSWKRALAANLASAREERRESPILEAPTGQNSGKGLNGDASSPVKKRPFPEALEFSYAALTNQRPDASFVAFWKNRSLSNSEPRFLARSLLDQIENHDETFWEELGIGSFLDLDESDWLALSPVIFVVGVFKRLSGKTPSVHVVLALLETIVAGQTTPRAVIEFLARDLKASKEGRDVLLKAYPRRFFRWLRLSNRNKGSFDRVQALNSIMLLNMARHLSRMDWGLLPVQMIYNSQIFLHQQND